MPLYFSPWPSPLPTNWQTSLGLSHFLTTVTPSHTSLLIPINHHTSLSTDTPLLYFSHLSDDCHTSCQLSYLQIPPNTSLITITSLHPLTPPPWPSHLSINWHSLLTPPWWLLHFLPSDTPPQALLLLPMTITPPHQLTNLLKTVTLPDNCHTFQHLITPPS